MRESFPNYYICTELKIDDLEESVNLFVIRGYTPVGGITVERVAGDYASSYSYRYHQAMLLESP